MMINPAGGGSSSTQSSSPEISEDFYIADLLRNNFFVFLSD